MAEAQERLLVIAAGGTGGHMFPAQALAQEMLRRGWRVALSTDERGLRYADGFPDAVERRETKAATLSQGSLLDKARAPFEILAGASETVRWFQEARPSAVAGFGGYPSLPALAAAWRLGLPRLIHEQNGVLGKVNALFATRVDALAAGVQPIRNLPPGTRLAFTGNPLRDAARAVCGTPYAPPAAGGEIRLLVFGGSQGARVFADMVPPAVALLPEALRERIVLVQQVREEDRARVQAVYASAGIHGELAPFFSDLPETMAAAHLIIARAGASSIAEITAIGRPSILAPYPHAAGDHQTANAAALRKAGAAVVTPDAEMTPQGLAATLEALFAEPERLTEMAVAAKALGRPNAAERLADLTEKVARGDAVG
ncbi:MAG: undecaprenyldiphospho-muramoylpentapeptide beta-N-acetylglucosaminyltransferase [Pseudomonadota bacterium]